MSDVPRNLGQQLTALETVSPAARADYEQRLRRIFEERLSVPLRGWCLVAGLICLLFGAAVCYVVFFDLEAYRYWPNLMLGFVATLTAVTVGIALIGVSIRGVYRRQHEGRWAASSCLAALATWGLFMLIAAFGLPDFLRGIFLALGLVCLTTAAFVANRIATTRAQLVLEKRLLEIKYHMADISERLAR